MSIQINMNNTELEAREMAIDTGQNSTVKDRSEKRYTLYLLFSTSASCVMNIRKSAAVITIKAQTNKPSVPVKAAT